MWLGAYVSNTLLLSSSRAQNSSPVPSSSSRSDPSGTLHRSDAPQGHAANVTTRRSGGQGSIPSLRPDPDGRSSPVLFATTRRTSPPSSIHTHSSLGTDAPSHHMGGTVHPYHPPSHHIHHNMGGLPPPPTLWGVHLLPTTTTITITLVRVWAVEHTLHTIIRITITVVVAIHYHRGICIHPPITIWRVMHLPSSRVCLPQAAVCILLP